VEAWTATRVLEVASDTRVREFHLPQLWLCSATSPLAPLQHLHNHNRDALTTTWLEISQLVTSKVDTFNHWRETTLAQDAYRVSTRTRLQSLPQKLLISVHLSFFTSNFKPATTVYDTLTYYQVSKQQDLDTQSSGSRPSSRPLHPLTYTFNRLPKIPIAIVHLYEQEMTDRVAGRRRSQYGSLYEDLASAQPYASCLTKRACGAGPTSTLKYTAHHQHECQLLSSLQFPISPLTVSSPSVGSCKWKPDRSMPFPYPITPGLCASATHANHVQPTLASSLSQLDIVSSGSGVGVRAQHRKCSRMNADPLCVGCQTRHGYTPLRRRTLHWSSYLYTDECWFLQQRMRFQFMQDEVLHVFPKPTGPSGSAQNRTGPAYD
jgi:hypothetical protein